MTVAVMVTGDPKPAVLGAVAVVVVGARDTVMVCGWPIAAGVMVLAAVTVKVDVPAVVGVPDRTPVTGLRLNPAGSAPVETRNVGAGDPVAAKVAV